MPVKAKPVSRMFHRMAGVIIKASRARGCSSITSEEGGREARATAAKVSIMRLTHRICVTVSGLCVPINEPIRTMRQAATLTVSWKRMNRWIFL